MWKSYGIMGGWITAAIAISICWYMNHWMGIIRNPPGRIWVDQGWAVSAAGIAWAMVRFDARFRHAVPVLICCLLGGALAGAAANKVNRQRSDSQESTAAGEAEKSAHA
jgi:hypothetical protein